MAEIVLLLDALEPAARHEVQLGPLLRSINSRSCPAARQGGDYDTIANQLYCQVCHKVGKSVQRCKSCRLVAYCGEAHLAEDAPRHNAWCSELLFSRVLQGAFRMQDYDKLSRFPPSGSSTSTSGALPPAPIDICARARVGHPAYKCAGLPMQPGLPAGWAAYFTAKREGEPRPTSDNGRSAVPAPTSAVPPPTRADQAWRGAGGRSKRSWRPTRSPRCSRLPPRWSSSALPAGRSSRSG
jgi:hypothetical protein